VRTTTLKSLAAVVLTGIGSALVVGFRTQETPLLATSRSVSAATAAPATGSGSTAAAGGTSSATTTAPSTATPAGTAATAAAYADGTWTGQAVDEPWGTFQVEAVVSGGKITDVVLVAAPQDNHSDRINSQAVPTLTQAAVAQQGAGIDLVSGATWTSESYITSLQAALDQARAAAVTAS
jgi:uncharacterized protein with FMN-binding domain